VEWEVSFHHNCLIQLKGLPSLLYEFKSPFPLGKADFCSVKVKNMKILIFVIQSLHSENSELKVFLINCCIYPFIRPDVLLFYFLNRAGYLKFTKQKRCIKDSNAVQ